MGGECDADRIPCRRERIVVHTLALALIVFNTGSACAYARSVARRFADARQRARMRPHVAAWLPRAAATLVAAHFFWLAAVCCVIAKAWVSPACCAEASDTTCCFYMPLQLSVGAATCADVTDPPVMLTVGSR